MPDNPYDALFSPANPRDRVHGIASKIGISPDIADDYLNITKVESGHNINVGSSAKGAQGFGQVMPDRPGLSVRTISGRRYNLQNPDENIEAGLRLFSAGGSDPVGRRLEYFGGAGARQHYERTGRIPNISDGNLTAQQYVQATGGQRTPKPTPNPYDALFPSSSESDVTPATSTAPSVGTPGSPVAPPSPRKTRRLSAAQSLMQKLVLPPGQTNEGSDFKPVFGLGETYREWNPRAAEAHEKPGGMVMGDFRRREERDARIAREIRPQVVKDFFNTGAGVRQELPPEVQERQIAADPRLRQYVESETQRRATELEQREQQVYRVERGFAPPLGLADKIRDLRKNPEQLVPFLSSIPEINNLLAVGRSTDKLEKGEDLTTEEQVQLREFIAASKQNKTMMYQVADVISALPAFAGEFALTGGIYSAGRKTAIKGLEKLITKEGLALAEKKLASRLAVKVGTGLVGAAAQTIPAGATRIPAGVLYREAGGDSFGKALRDTLTDQFIEIASERAGGLLSEIPLPKKLAAIRDAVTERWLNKVPGRTVEQLQKVVEKTGWHGPLGEIFEERVGDVAKYATGLQPSPLPSLQQLAVEGLAFSVPTVGMAATERLANRREPKTPKPLETAPDVTERAEEAPITQTEDGKRPLVAEAPEAIHAQMDALTNRRGSRLGVLIPKGQSAPTRIPKGYMTTRTNEGVVIHPKELSADDIRELVNDGNSWRLLGHQNPVGPEATRIVVARAGIEGQGGIKPGTELLSSFVVPGQEQNAIEEMRAQFAPYEPAFEVGGAETAARVDEERGAPPAESRIKIPRRNIVISQDSAGKWQVSFDTASGQVSTSGLKSRSEAEQFVANYGRAADGNQQSQNQYDELFYPTPHHSRLQRRRQRGTGKGRFMHGKLDESSSAANVGPAKVATETRQQVASSSSPELKVAVSPGIQGNITKTITSPATEPTVTPPVESKTQPTATESQLTTRREVKDVTQEAAVVPGQSGNQPIVGKPLEAKSLTRAFADWRSRRAYIDGNGNYHLKTEGRSSGPIAPWNRRVKQTFKTVSEFHAAANEPLFGKTLDDRTAKYPPRFSVEGNHVNLQNPAAAKLLAKAYKALGYKGEAEGVFEDNPRRLIKQLLAMRDTDKKAVALADAVRKAARAGDGKVTIAFGEKGKQHELFHQSSHAANQLPQNRHADFRPLIEHPAFAHIRHALSKELKYPDSIPVLVEEGAAYIASGDYYGLGLSRQEAIDWLQLWFESFAKTHGDVSLERFGELAYEGQQALATALKQAQTKETSGSTDKGLRRMEEGRESRAGPSAPQAESARQELEYRGEHVAPDSEGGAPLHDLTQNEIYPDDVYGARGMDYRSGEEAMDREAYSLIQQVKGKPNAVVWVYRAVPKDVKARISKGDWVTPIRRYAVEHGKSNLEDYKIEKLKAHARDLFTDGNSWMEWGYDPQPVDMESRRKARKEKRQRDVERIRAGEKIIGINKYPADPYYENEQKFLDQAEERTVGPSPPQTESSEFKRWFGDSKVVDEDGKPLVVYHFTTKEAEQGIRETGFDPSPSRARARRSDEGVPDGIFFTPQGESVFSDQMDFARLAVYLKMESPLRVDTREDLMDWTSERDPEYAKLRKALAKYTMPVYKDLFERLQSDDADTKRAAEHEHAALVDQATTARARMTALLKQEGHDGVIMARDTGGPHVVTTMIVIEPTQVKSATDNRGTFDSENPNILFSLRPPKRRSQNALERLEGLAKARGQTLREAPTKADVAENRARIEDEKSGNRPTLTVVPSPERRPAEVKERSFPKTAESTGYRGGTDRDYRVLTNAASLESAQRRLTRLGAGAAAAELAQSDNPGAEDNALGILLMQQFERTGQIGRAVAVANDLSRKLTQAGQFVQAASIITRLSPEGVLLHAQKILKGKPLAEETALTIVAQAKAVTDAERLVAEIQKQRPDVFGPNGEILPRPRQSRATAPSSARTKIGTLQDRLATLEQQARERMQARAVAAQAEVATLPEKSQRGAGINPVNTAADLGDLVIIGAAKLARSGITQAVWLAEMAKEATALTKKDLRKLYRESFEMYERERKQFLQEFRVRGAQRQMGTTTASAADVQRVINERLDAMTAARKARAELSRTFRDLNAGRTVKILRGVRDVWGLTRALITSVDISAGGRQGKMGIVTHPKSWLRGFARQFRGMSKKQYERMVSEIQADPDYKYAVRFKLELTSVARAETSSLAAHEEVYQTELADKIPWLRISQQAYDTMLDTLRMGWFKAQLAKMRLAGIDLEDPNNKEMLVHDTGLINKFTGRGGDARLRRIAPSANAFAFSVRFWASRLEVLALPLNPRMYGVGEKAYSPTARADAWKTVFGFYGLIALQIALARLAGAEVNFDPDDPDFIFNPDSADFLKVKFGPHHVDFSAGLQSHLRVAARLAKSFYLREFREEKPRTGPAEIVSKYLRSKEEPNAALIHDLFFSDKKDTESGPRGTNYAGEAVYLTGKPGTGTAKRIGSSAIAQRILPIVLQDALAGWKISTGPGSTALALTASVLGEGVTTYSKGYSEKKEKWPMQPDLDRLQITINAPQRVKPGKNEKFKAETEEEYDARRRQEAEAIKVALQRLEGMNFYKTLPDRSKEAAIRATITAARESVRYQQPAQQRKQQTLTP